MKSCHLTGGYKRNINQNGQKKYKPGSDIPDPEIGANYEISF